MTNFPVKKPVILLKQLHKQLLINFNSKLVFITIDLDWGQITLITIDLHNTIEESLIESDHGFDFMGFYSI